MARYAWTVVLRNDDRDETLEYNVEAAGYSQAITFAIDQLRREKTHGYGWETISLKRGERVEQEAQTA